MKEDEPQHLAFTFSSSSLFVHHMLQAMHLSAQKDLCFFCPSIIRME